MPRAIEFESEAALTAAMEAFRREGFGGTSIKMLERETGLSSGSLYNSFGDKQAIFEKALQHYNNIVVSVRMDQHLSGQPAVEGLRSLFLSLLDEPGGGSSGCLLTNSAVELGAGAAPARDSIELGFQIQQRAFLEVAAQLSGVAESAPAVSVKLLALYQGILVLFRFGYPGTKLREMINFEFNTMGDN